MTHPEDRQQPPDTAGRTFSTDAELKAAAHTAALLLGTRLAAARRAGGQDEKRTA